MGGEAGTERSELDEPRQRWLMGTNLYQRRTHVQDGISLFSKQRYNPHPLSYPFARIGFAYRSMSDMLGELGGGGVREDEIRAIISSAILGLQVREMERQIARLRKYH